MRANQERDTTTSHEFDEILRHITESSSDSERMAYLAWPVLRIYVYSLFEGLSGSVHFLLDLKALVLLPIPPLPSDVVEFELFDGLAIF